MGRAPCCDKANVKKGPWSPEEDAQLKDYIDKYGTGGNWIALPQKAGLKRCGKSCRLRWLNYLRPNIKHGEFSEDEDRIICSLYANIGSRWSIIAAQLPGRTDNDIKNYWNTKLKKKLMMVMANSKPSKSPFSHHKIKPNTPYNYNPALPSSPPFTSLSNYHNAPATLSFSAFDQSTLLSNLPASAAALPQPPLQGSYLVFGGAPEPSCSSSDGSDQQKYASFYQDQDQKMGFSSGFLGSGVWEETGPVMDDGLEEIKQLISTNSYCSSNFYFDENKVGERAMLYY